MDSDIIAGIIVLIIAISFAIFMIAGIPILFWFYIINPIPIVIQEKILIFIFFYLLYLKLLL